MNKQFDSMKNAVQEQFGKNASKYVTSTTHSKGSDLSILHEWLEVQPSSTVLDIATGGGHVVKALSPHVKQVIATDLTYPMLQTAKNYLDSFASNVFYVIADAESLPFLENTFDVVTCRIAAHHFPNPQLFIKEVARVLKPSGKLLLIDNIAPEEEALDVFVNRLEKLRDQSHVRSYSISEWTHYFENAGLTIAKNEKRKKTLAYPEWVERTTESKKQVEAVNEHLLSANETLTSYFAINKNENGIQSIEIDEWMALAQKN